MVPATTTSNQIRTVVKRGLSCFDISSPNWELVIGKWPVSRKVIWFTHDQANENHPIPLSNLNGIYIVFGINQHVRMSSFQTYRSCFFKCWVATINWKDTLSCLDTWLFCKDFGKEKKHSKAFSIHTLSRQRPRNRAFWTFWRIGRYRTQLEDNLRANWWSDL